MQLTRHTDYAFRVLIYLCDENRERLVRASEIAEVFDVSLHHLSKVIHQLGRTGFIITVRGKHGGIKLAVESQEISLGAVVRAMEATLNPINCDEPECRLSPNCRLKSILNDAMEAFVNTMDKYTLADISQQEVRELLVIQARV